MTLVLSQISWTLQLMHNCTKIPDWTLRYPWNKLSCWCLIREVVYIFLFSKPFPTVWSIIFLSRDIVSFFLKVLSFYLKLPDFRKFPEKVASLFNRSMIVTKVKFWIERMWHLLFKTFQILSNRLWVGKLHSKVFQLHVVILNHRDSFGKEKKKKKTCSIFDKTLSKVFLNNFYALNRS